MQMMNSPIVQQQVEVSPFQQRLRCIRLCRFVALKDAPAQVRRYDLTPADLFDESIEAGPMRGIAGEWVRAECL